MCARLVLRLLLPARMNRRLVSLVLIAVVAGCSGGGEISTGSSGSGSGGSSGSSGGSGAGATGGSGAGATGGEGSTGAGGSGAGATGGGSGSTGAGGSGSGSTGSGAGATGGGGTGTLVAVDGAYDTVTQFNLLDALPPEVKTAFDLIISFADSPGAFLLDQADKIPVIKYVIDAINLFSGVRDKIVMAIDEYINNWSGGMVTTMHDLAQQLEAALRGLSMHNHIVVGKPDASGNVTVEDTLVDITFTWNGQPYAYAQNTKSTYTAKATGLKLALPGHQYDKGLDFGGVIVDLLDNVALPDLTGVSSLGALANQLVDCGGVGDWVWGYIGNICIGSQCLASYISSNDIAKLCTNALQTAGDAVESQLASLTAPGKLALGDGSCLAVENHGHTGHADSLTNGTWSLTIPVASTQMTLPGTFTGSVAH
jgi:hypothetical protein